MTHLGLSSKREVTRPALVGTAMAVQVREQGRYLADAGRRTGTG